MQVSSADAQLERSLRNVAMVLLQHPDDELSLSFVAKFTPRRSPLVQHPRKSTDNRAGRKLGSEPLMSFASLGGATLGAISLALPVGSQQGRQSATTKQLGSDLEHLPERAAKVAPEALGLGRAEAEKVTYRPLPTMELPRFGRPDWSRSSCADPAPWPTGGER